MLAFAISLVWSGAHALEPTTPTGPLNTPALYPEGPVFIGGALYYAEMTGDRVVKWDDAGRATFFEMKGCGPTSVSPFGDGKLAVTCHLGDAIAIVSAGGETLKVITTSIVGERLTLPNDSHTDRAGGVYFSSSGPFNIRAQPSGRVFHMKPDGSVALVAKGLWYSNGVFATKTGMLYVSEHMGKKILRYRIAKDGSLTPLAPFADIAKLVPDIAAARDRAKPGLRKTVLRLASLGWLGLPASLNL